MVQKRFKIEEIIPKLCKVEMYLFRGYALEDACRKTSVTERTYHHWCKENGYIELVNGKLGDELLE
ncbi:MAG: hypothetical protein ACOYJW_06045 [Candidatus Omnitrophota bacterium]